MIWAPVVLVAGLQSVLYAQLVYQPRAVPAWLLRVSPDFLWSASCLLFYVPTSLVVWTFQYRRTADLNERRRLRLWFAGMLTCGIAAMTSIVLRWFVPASAAQAFYLSPFSILLFSLYFTGPIAFAYAVLHHRVFDLGLLLRRGLQYALARRLLLSAVPALAVIFVADLLLHGDQPILAVLRERGWIYAALVAIAAIAYTKRQSWLETLESSLFSRTIRCSTTSPRGRRGSARGSQF